MSEDTTQFHRRGFLKATGAAGFVAGTGVAVGATPGRSPGPKENEVLVGTTAPAGAPGDVVEPLTPDYASVVHENAGLGYAAVRFDDDAPEGAMDQFIEAVQQAGPVKYAEHNATHESFYTPNDPYYSDQYAPQMVNADDAWDYTLGDGSVLIGVVDTGIQYDHPDLDGNMSGADSNHGYDFVDNDEDPYPDVKSDEYHGTHVAGIAAAETDNGEGVAGVSESSVLACRALDENGQGSTSDIADAIEYAADMGADVINLSLGGGGYSTTMKNAVSYAASNGVFIAGAAGNDGSWGVSYPAGYAESTAVSALDSDGSLASYSNYGDDVELCAPGTDVLSTTTDARGDYEQLSGTSMATPVVAGCAGLTLARHSVDETELAVHLKYTADDVGLARSEQGNGRVDAYDAVRTTPSTTHDSGSVTDSLGGSGDSDCWYRSWSYADPRVVVVEIEGPTDADFDLYVNEGSGSCPSTSSYSYKSYSSDSQERITIKNPDTSADLYMLVDSYSGSGEYTLTITEYDTP